MWGRLRGSTTAELFGREGELADLVRLLGRHRLVTVTGAAGVGKSRLAAAAAMAVAGHCPDGVLRLRYWAGEGTGGTRAPVTRLRGGRRRSARPPVGPVDLAEPRDVGRLAAWLSGRRALLLLDDLDPVREAGIRALPALLQRAPGVRLLATGRQPLGLGDEEVLRLGPLPVAPEGDTAGAAVRLFLARAAEPGRGEPGVREETDVREESAVRQRPGARDGRAAWGTVTGPRQRDRTAAGDAEAPESASGEDGAREGGVREGGAREVGEAEPLPPPAHARKAPPGVATADAAEVCRWLEGRPLAVELAAAQFPRIPVAHLARLLSLSQSWLAAGAGRPLWRHRSLRAAVGSSYTLCERRERIVWARLSVFVGEFDERAAVAVCAGSEIRPDEVPAALARLTMASVLEAVRDPGGVRPGRYRLPGAEREFGAERLRAAGETAAATALHRRHYHQLADTTAQLWHGGRHRQALRMLREEAANVRAALRRAPGEGEEAAAALRTAVGLWFWWVVSGREAEGLDLLQPLLTHCPGDNPARPRGLWLAGWLAVHARDPRAAELLGQAWSGAVLGGDDATVGRTLHAQGLLAYLGRDAESAVGHLEEATRITPADTAYGPPAAVSWAVLAVAQAERSPGAALRSARRALADPGLRRDVWARSVAQYARAFVDHRLGRTGRAWRRARRALAAIDSLDGFTGMRSRACLETLLRRIEG